MGSMSAIWCLSILLSTNLPLYLIFHHHCICVYLARNTRIIKTYTRNWEKWYQPEMLEFRELMAPNIALYCVAEYKTSCFLLGNLLVYIILLKKFVSIWKYGNKVICELCAYSCAHAWQPTCVWKWERGVLILNINVHARYNHSDFARGYLCVILHLSFRNR